MGKQTYHQTFGLVSISPPATHLIVDVSVCNVDTMVTTPRTTGASGPHTLTPGIDHCQPPAANQRTVLGDISQSEDSPADINIEHVR